ncbi:hypothetical protein CLOM_g5368 [Closterium sp. NIES-68]|nr:hypothetical protein CLOM_g5368 [Closterium sp. NIES-68]GJP81911.1 hypothetical protein CLOP_g12043 [Closterium sp. NIES-67]
MGAQTSAAKHSAPADTQPPLGPIMSTTSPLHIRVHRSAPNRVTKRRPHNYAPRSPSAVPPAAAHLSPHGRKPATRGSLFAAILGAPGAHPAALALAIVGAACVVCILVLVGIQLSSRGMFKSGADGGWRRGMGGR